MAFQFFGEFALAPRALEQTAEPRHPATKLSQTDQVHVVLPFRSVIVLLPDRIPPTSLHSRNAFPRVVGRFTACEAVMAIHLFHLSAVMDVAPDKNRA